jgi:hypothetical protein
MKPKIDEILDIASLIREKYKKKDLSNMTIEFKLSPIDLKRLDEELFYRNDGKKGNYEMGTVVVVNVGDVNFRFTIEEKDA